MPKIHHLKIEHFRCIEKFEYTFADAGFVCLIGKGDSGKSTILEAISYALAPTYYLPIFDTDFYNCDIQKEILIELTLTDLPPKLLQEHKFGLHIRGLDKENKTIHDDLLDNHLPALTIRFSAGKDLEPKWQVISGRQEPVDISSGDRALLNLFYVSDYVDRHFTWSRTSPLSALLKLAGGNGERDTLALIQALREAKNKMDETASFGHLDAAVAKIKETAKNLGINIDNTSTRIDLKDISVKEDKISLHEENIPFRLKGKGSKRLISVAIQSTLAKEGGILLIDEVEQGLEPDRAQHLARVLKENKSAQVFITTHSRDILVELQATDIFMKQKGNASLITFDATFQGCLRSSPEAFFAKKIIVCEGATEVGICRAINAKRNEKSESNFAALRLRAIDGTGNTFVENALLLRKAGFDVCALCDSDDEVVNVKKESLTKAGVTVIDCEKGNSIERQVFSDMPWEAVMSLLRYGGVVQNRNGILDALKNQVNGDLNEKMKVDSPEIRTAIFNVSVRDKKEWFKRIDHGEHLGNVCIEYANDLNNKHLGKQFERLNKWIDG